MDYEQGLNDLLMERIFRLFAVMRRVPKLADGEAPVGGRPSAQNRILVMLSESDGISQRDMTTLLQLRPQSVSETLSKLECSGLVERRQSKLDKRVFNVFLTEEGRERATDLVENRPDFSALFLSPLSDQEKEQLLELLGKLTGAYGPDGFDGSDGSEEF